jgi:hypothetical protein
MAKASKKRGKKKSAQRKAKSRKPARRAPAKRKSVKRPAKRKPAKRAPQGEPWPMIFAVLLALAVALIAGWHFNGSAEAAELLGNLSSTVVTEFRATDTWLTIAHPHFIPTVN